MAALPLSPPVFSILSGLIEARAGLHYSPSDQELLAQKVSERALEAGFDSLLDYYYFLRYDPAGPAALDALIEALTVHETYFFREHEQLRALVDGVIAPRLRAGQPLRVWSAACSTRGWDGPGARGARAPRPPARAAARARGRSRSRGR